MASHIGVDYLAAKFRGCLIGGLLGDCFGEPFEIEIIDVAPRHRIMLGELASSAASQPKKVVKNYFLTLLLDPPEAGEKNVIQKYMEVVKNYLLTLLFGPPEAGEKNVIQKYMEVVKNYFLTLLFGPPGKGANKVHEYTDDTAMAISVAKSLVEKGAYDPQDMAEKFVNEYFRRPYIGYGAGVVRVFRALRRDDCKDVFEPAKQQFGGKGSYGNGAAMRVAPVALFGYRNEDLVKQVAENSSRITHTHQHGYNGAILQALAVHQALMADASADFNPVQFVDTLLEKIEKIEKPTNSAGFVENNTPYCDSLKRMKEIFETSPVNITAEEVAAIFGNHVSAYKSVPTAIFSFLRGFQPLEDFESDNPFVRTLYFAITVGGDTDTIACMAGSIAGAYHGESVIPSSLMRRCVAVDELRNLADQLFQMCQN